MKNIIFAVMLGLIIGPALGAHIEGKWGDPKPPSGTYVPNYGAECTVDGVVSYAVNDLLVPEFAIDLTATVGQTVECRMQGINVFVPASPVFGPWDNMTTAIPVETPSALVPGTLIIIY